MQHALNCAYSTAVGMPKDRIALSTVPPTAPPAPALRLDLPYAVALRELFQGYRMRAQMNTKYIESDTREATVTHTLNVLLSRLASADIQSTITPDEGRNVPWHYNSIHAINTAKQALLGLDGLREFVEIKRDGALGAKVRELKERAILFLEEILGVGGYFEAVSQGFFVDSGFYPERHGDGIARDIKGGIGFEVVQRAEDYFAPVCAHYGENHVPSEYDHPCAGIDGCTLCVPEKIKFIDEFDPEDNADKRLERSRPFRTEVLRPEVEWAGDGIVGVTLFLPTDERTAHFASLEIAKNMNLLDAEVIHKQVLHPAEGTLIEIKGKIDASVNPAALKMPQREDVLSADEIRRKVAQEPLHVVAATVGEDEHSVGLREILDIKHGGIEGFGIKFHYLGTSVPVSKVVDAALEVGADAILISTIITHGEVHRLNMERLHQLCVERGVRGRFILIGGGTQVKPELAKAWGMDGGFGRGTKGIDVASFLVKFREQKRKKSIDI